MNPKEITSSVRDIVAEVLSCDVRALEDDEPFADIPGYDSLDQVEITMELEEKFALEIPDEDADHFKSVGDVIRYVTEKKGDY